MVLIQSTADQSSPQAAAVVGTWRRNGWHPPRQSGFPHVLTHQMLGFDADFDRILSLFEVWPGGRMLLVLQDPSVPAGCRPWP